MGAACPTRPLNMPPRLVMTLFRSPGPLALILALCIMKKGSWVLNNRIPRGQYDEEDGKPWKTLRKGDVLCHSTAKFSCWEGSWLCLKIVAERGCWDSETAVWVSLWEAGWDVGIWPHFYAGAPTCLPPAGLSSIPDTPAKLSKAYSRQYAIP